MTKTVNTVMNGKCPTHRFHLNDRHDDSPFVSLDSSFYHFTKSFFNPFWVKAFQRAPNVLVTYLKIIFEKRVLFLLTIALLMKRKFFIPLIPYYQWYAYILTPFLWIFKSSRNHVNFTCHVGWCWGKPGIFRRICHHYFWYTNHTWSLRCSDAW